MDKKQKRSQREIRISNFDHERRQTCYHNGRIRTKGENKHYYKLINAEAANV